MIIVLSSSVETEIKAWLHGLVLGFDLLSNVEWLVWFEQFALISVHVVPLVTVPETVLVVNVVSVINHTS